MNYIMSYGGMMNRKLRIANLFIGIISAVVVITGNIQPFFYGFILGIFDYILSCLSGLDGADPELSGAGIVFLLSLLIMFSAGSVFILTIDVFCQSKKPDRRKCTVLYTVNCILLVLSIIIGRFNENIINKINSSYYCYIEMNDLYYAVHKADGVILIAMIAITVICVAYMRKDAKSDLT